LTTLLAIMKYMSRPKSAAANDIDIDIDIADILGQKYRYRIDIGKGDIVPPLTSQLAIAVEKLPRRRRQKKTNASTNQLNYLAVSRKRQCVGLCIRPSRS